MRNILFILIALTCLAACKKHHSPKPDNPYGLPNATQTGANIFACRVDGSNWITKFSSYNIKTSFLTSNDRDSFSIFASGTTNAALDLIQIAISDSVKTGNIYNIADTNKVRVNTLRLFAPCGQTTGYGGSQWNKAISGSLKITKYSGTYFVPSCCTYGTYESNSIIAGTFEFIVPVANCDTIRVTDGRFDINYSRW